MLYAIGVGPLQSEDGKFFTRAIVDLADMVSVRDKGSNEILRLLGADTENIPITADPE